MCLRKGSGVVFCYPKIRISRFSRSAILCFLSNSPICLMNLLLSIERIWSTSTFETFCKFVSFLERWILRIDAFFDTLEVMGHIIVLGWTLFKRLVCIATTGLTFPGSVPNFGFKSARYR